MTTNITESGSIENETILRQEIIESQKTQADFLKWKLISVATVGALSFGFTSDVKLTAGSAKLLLCMVPVLCAYVDLISLHLMIRIITIGLYLKIQGNKYESYIGEIRERSKTNPFIFEVGALHGSSLLFNIIVVGLGFALPKGPDNWPEQYLTAYVVAGVLGIVWTIFLWTKYTFRVREVSRLAEEVLSTRNSPEAHRQ
jgi:hypothetical protein